MGIRILLYHTRMLADFAPMLHKLASRCMLHSMYSVCKRYAKVYHYVNFKVNI